jgi:antitoxin MazE
MKAQMVRWGNSLAVRIPKPITAEARISEGDYVEIEASEGRIQLRRASKSKRLRLEDLIRQITPENRYTEMNSGPEIGRERIEW